MRTIKTYSKGAPFYNASRYRHVGFSAVFVTGQMTITPFEQSRPRGGRYA